MRHAAAAGLPGRELRNVPERHQLQHHQPVRLRSEDLLCFAGVRHDLGRLRWYDQLRNLPHRLGLHREQHVRVRSEDDLPVGSAVRNGA